MPKAREGCAFRNAKGHWVVRYPLPEKDERGKPRMKQRTLPAKYDGMSPPRARELALHLEEKEADRARELRTVATDTIAKLAERWVDDLVEPSTAFAPATKTQHTTYIGRAVDAFGEKRLDELTTGDLRGWLRALSRRYAPITVRNNINTLSRFWQDARGENWTAAPNLCRDPIVREALPSIETRPAEDIEHLTHAQAVQLLASDLALEKRTRYALAILGGLRDGELAGLQWQDIEDKAMKVRRAFRKIGDDDGAPALGKLKTGSSRRVVPVHPFAADLLEAWRNERWPDGPADDDPVFPDEHGHHCRPRSAEELRADLEAVGLPTDYTGGEKPLPFKFHHLRHTFSTLLEAAGVNGYVIDALLGHTPKTTRGRHYSGANMDTLRAAIEAVEMPRESSSKAVTFESLRERKRDQKSDKSAQVAVKIHGSAWHPGGAPGLQNPGDAEKAQNTAVFDGLGRQSEVSDGSEVRETPSAPASVPPQDDPVEAALAEALRGATAAGQWTVVAQLAGELEARRKARAGVVSLDAERVKRGVR